MNTISPTSARYAFGFASRFGLLVMLLLAWLPKSQAQTSDVEFANYYFDNQEYDKAAIYFTKLWDKSYNAYFYQRLYTCYLRLNEFEKAEEIIKRQIKVVSNKSEVTVDLVELYVKVGDRKKKERAIEQALNAMEPNRTQIAITARKLVALGEMDAAEKAYQIGIKELNGDYNFAFELADLYGAQGNLQKMTDAYIALVAANPSYIPTIQNVLNRYLNLTEEPERGELVRVALLNAIQKNPENASLVDMLIWLFYQTKNYPAAFIQLKSADKRYLEDGSRLVDFAEMCIRNKAFSTAREAYLYLQSAGKDAFVTEIATAGLAKASFLELEDRAAPDPESINQTGALLSEAIAKLGVSDATADLLSFYTQFLVTYKQDPTQSIELLTQAIEAGNLNPKKSAELKLQLGDYHVLAGDIWEASLLYSQVDKSFKDDVLGSEAKFRNAKISYYTGDFEWAQDQLDVLKASTSKLIANDALQLSLRITDNLGLDSLQEPMELFAKADLYIYQNLLSEAETTLDSLQFTYPGHPLADEIWFAKAAIAAKQKNYVKAGEWLTKITENYGEDLLGDDALFLWAEYNRKYLNNLPLAQKLYEQLISTYPSSLYVIEARKRFRDLRGDQLQAP
ncbi:MAG TPA: tetratricopeptide repeat protein [Luteibaculaceae bacterium]|nr:tetratricopeptide repeat protein [Luteibaculaceae bacterium]